ncbi:MAG: hypothetical protein Q4C95_04320 [Planctomycetia bacterium]|nr:hypothetical protein [Planctomycetia bacterium]
MTLKSVLNRYKPKRIASLVCIKAGIDNGIRLSFARRCRVCKVNELGLTKGLIIMGHLSEQL